MITVSACSPIQGYPGPERPDTEVTIIKPVGGEEALFDSASIDGTPFGRWGIAVLPGQHDARLGWRFKGPPRNCEKYSELDSASYAYCLKREKQDTNCSCWDHLSVYQRCTHDIRVVRCQGDFQGDAGELYQLGMTGDFDSPKAELRSARRGWILECSNVGLEEADFTESLGSGFYTAVNAGVSATSACMP